MSYHAVVFFFFWYSRHPPLKEHTVAVGTQASASFLVSWQTPEVGHPSNLIDTATSPTTHFLDRTQNCLVFTLATKS